MRPANEIATVRGTVEKLFYSSLKFSAGRLRVDAARSVSFAGALMVRLHDAVILHGTWETHTKYGLQLKVRYFEFDQQPTPEGLAHYLASNPELKGIGPVKAARIAEVFGETFDQVIDEDPARVAKVARVPLATIELLREEWLRTRAVNASMQWLSQFEVTHFQASSLIGKFGNSVVTVLQEDPYLLVREIPGFGFKRVDMVARKLGTPKDHPGRIRAGVVHCVLDRLDQGDCWVDDETLVELANTLLVMDTADSRQRVERALEELIENGTLACVSIDGRFLIAQPRILEMERDLAGVFATGLGPNPHLAGAAAVPILAIDPQLNPGQVRAVQLAVDHNLVVLSGGAGVGKTRIIGTLVNLYVRQAKSVVLAAPTGKAAKRIEEVVRREASTIHRLLGFKNGTFSRDIDNPIDAAVVIIDEVSMVDVPLAWHLFRAIDLRRTCVVLVGDDNQLPPVGPGNLLRDLIDRQPVPTVVLDQVVRQAGALKENSLAILRGEVRKTAPADASGSYPWVVANRFTEVLNAQQYVLELFDHVLAERLGYDLLRDVQLLSPTKKGPLGTEDLNALLQQLVQKKLWSVEVAERLPNRRPDLLLHDRVIQTRNNYHLDVMNGAVGVVTQVGNKPGELTVRFDDHEVAYTSETVRDLSLAYALTVHKCVHPDTLVETPQGLLPIRSIRRDGGVVATPDGQRTYDAFIENPDGELLEIVTVDGYSLTVTPDHGIDVWTDDGFARLEARDIGPSAVLRLKLGVTCDPIEAPLLGDPPAVPPNARRYHYPRTVTADLAEFLGLMIANGHVDRRGFCFTSRHADVRDRVAELSQVLFGARPSLCMIKNTYGAMLTAKELVGWLHQLGGMEPRDKSVPHCILRSPLPLQIAFLRGLFENGCAAVHDGALTHIAWVSQHVALRQFVRTLLLRLGIITGGVSTQPAAVRLHGQNARKFGERVGFVARAKQARMRYPSGKETRGLVPLTTSEIETLRAGGVSRAAGISSAYFMQVRRRITRHSAEAIIRRIELERQDDRPAAREALELLRDKLEYHYSPVREVRRLTGPSMCLHVPDGHRFLQNGFCAWNSQGSQAPCVVAIVHKAHSFQLHRNLIYTAVTRAQKTVILVGDQWAMRTGAQKQQVERRKTFLSVLEFPGRDRSLPSSAGGEEEALEPGR